VLMVNGVWRFQLFFDHSLITDHLSHSETYSYSSDLCPPGPRFTIHIFVILSEVEGSLTISSYSYSADD
jgi:hypothetical protein